MISCPQRHARPDTNWAHHVESTELQNLVLRLGGEVAELRERNALLEARLGAVHDVGNRILTLLAALGAGMGRTVATPGMTHAEHMAGMMAVVGGALSDLLVDWTAAFVDDCPVDAVAEQRVRLAP